MRNYAPVAFILVFILVGMIFMASSCQSKTDKSNQNTELPAGHPITGKKAPVENNSIMVEPAHDGVSIAQLFKNRKTHKDKIVKVRGEVVKVNSGILGKNWVHIQDGTKYQKDFDLTITTDAVVEVGSVVTFEGTISLNKDYGAGYSYEVIMENAILVEDS
jgi:hypothetical protein